jgi:hypothetical protein
MDISEEIRLRRGLTESLETSAMRFIHGENLDISEGRTTLESGNGLGG